MIEQEGNQQCRHANQHGSFWPYISTKLEVTPIPAFSGTPQALSLHQYTCT